MGISTFRVGSDFYVEIGAVQYPFRTVDLNGTAQMVNRRNSKHQPGSDVYKSNGTSLELTGEGPYDSAEVTLTLGDSYTVGTYAYDGHVGWEGTALLSAFKFTGDQEGGDSNVSVTFMFTATDLDTYPRAFPMGAG